MKFDNSCYFMSKERLSWQESREACQKQGGDLAVIDSEHVQVKQSVAKSGKLKQTSLLKHSAVMTG